jgi:hypothetical protein
MGERVGEWMGKRVDGWIGLTYTPTLSLTYTLLIHGTIIATYCHLGQSSSLI